MGLTAKGKRSNSEGWGMGFFLVFFPEEQESPSSITNIKKNNNPFISNSPSSCTINTLLKRINSTSNHILSRTQSTISICALLIFLTLLLFTLSTFDPNPHLLLQTHNSNSYKKLPIKSSYSKALQGLGTLYTRGTRAMNDLIISHVEETVSVKELQLFLRLFHRSGLASRSDLLFIFPSTCSTSFDGVIREENDSFLQLLHSFNSSNLRSSFDVTQFLKSSKKEAERAQPIWGRKIPTNSTGEGETGLTRPSYGSVVGFSVGELDPENSLSGFLDNHVPMSLRRWACYPMLLGRLRRNFKNVMFVDVKQVLLLGDPLGRVRTQSPETVHLSTTTTTSSKHARKNSDKTHQKTVNPAIIMGGARGIRRLSTSMLTEIVRATTQQHKRKNPVTESGLLSQLVLNEFVLKNIKLVTSTESIPDVSSLSGLNSDTPLSLVNSAVIRRGNSNIDIDGAIMKHVCSFALDSSVYTDC